MGAIGKHGLHEFGGGADGALELNGGGGSEKKFLSDWYQIFYWYLIVYTCRTFISMIKSFIIITTVWFDVHVCTIQTLFIVKV